MIKKLFLLLPLLAFSQVAFSQNGNSEKRPQAYLVSRGETRQQAYLVSRGDTRPAPSRPRIVNAVVDNKKVAHSSRKDFTLEREVFDLINVQRAKVGLGSLKWNEDVARMARLHSENMANFRFFSHTDLNGLMVNDRADALGINKWRAIGENIAYNRGYENPAQSAVERWMQSSAHRDNLLNNRWRESGIGIAITEDGTYYFTEVFLLRK